MYRILLIGFLLLFTSGLAGAQPGQSCMKQSGMNMKGGMNMKDMPMNMKDMPGMRYDVSTETTITGTVQDVLRPQNGRMMGIHLTVKTATETIEVHLGPSDFIANAGFSFAKGDSVQVLGSIVMMDDGEFLIAREITKDGKTLKLRDKTGRPCGRAEDRERLLSTVKSPSRCSKCLLFSSCCVDCPSGHKMHCP
jgi:hypothetical protein